VVVVILEGIARPTPVDDRYKKVHISYKKGLRGRSGDDSLPSTPAKVRLITSLIQQAFFRPDHTFV